MTTYQCSACNSATLIDSQAIHRLAIAAGVIDNALRQYTLHARSKAHQDQPWSSLNTLLEALPAILHNLHESVIQSESLAISIEKSWLEGFDSVCLRCGLMFLSE